MSQYPFLDVFERLLRFVPPATFAKVSMSCVGGLAEESFVLVDRGMSLLLCLVAFLSER